MWRERWLPFFRCCSPIHYVSISTTWSHWLPRRFSPSVTCFVLTYAFNISSSSSCLIHHSTSFINIWEEHYPYSTAIFLWSALDVNGQKHSLWQISSGNKHGIYHLCLEGEGEGRRPWAVHSDQDLLLPWEVRTLWNPERILALAWSRKYGCRAPESRASPHTLHRPALLSHKAERKVNHNSNSWYLLST